MSKTSYVQNIGATVRAEVERHGDNVPKPSRIKFIRRLLRYYGYALGMK